MASVTDICNRALQKLGAKRITSIDENSNNARSCKACYEILRDSELTKYRWSFAIKRVEIAADVDTPPFGMGNYFTLPADFLKLIPPDTTMDTNERDWIIENGKIVTSDSSPLYVRYVAKITETGKFDAPFVEALAARMAFEMCEEITQSVNKKESIKDDYKMAISEAKKSNSIQNVPVVAVEDSWISKRY